jgi:hypothetical protein
MLLAQRKCLIPSLFPHLSKKKATKKVETEKIMPIMNTQLGIGIGEINLLSKMAPSDHLLISNRYLLRFSNCLFVIHLYDETLYHKIKICMYTLWCILTQHLNLFKLLMYKGIYI